MELTIESQEHLPLENRLKNVSTQGKTAVHGSLIKRYNSALELAEKQVESLHKELTAARSNNEASDQQLKNQLDVLQQEKYSLEAENKTLKEDLEATREEVQGRLARLKSKFVKFYWDSHSYVAKSFLSQLRKNWRNNITFDEVKEMIEAIKAPDPDPKKEPANEA